MTADDIRKLADTMDIPRVDLRELLRALTDVMEAAKCAENFLVDWFVIDEGAPPPPGLGDAINAIRISLYRVEALRA